MIRNLLASVLITALMVLSQQSNAIVSINNPITQATVTKTPEWLLNDVQRAEQTDLTKGENYILYYGGTTTFNLGSEMQHIWFGVFNGVSRRMDFGTNLYAVYDSLKTKPGSFGDLFEINVLEQQWQNKKLIGHLVPAMCVSVGNGDYIAFAKDQVVTASDNSGYIRYTVFSVKGIKIEN